MPEKNLNKISYTISLNGEISQKLKNLRNFENFTKVKKLTKLRIY